MFEQEWTQQLLNSTHIGILVVDKDRNNLFINDELSRMFGYTKAELLTTKAEILHTSHDSFKNFGEKAFEFVLSGDSIGIDYQFKKKDGTIFWCHIAGDLITNQTEVLWTLVDITKRKTLELQHYEQAQLIQQMQDAVVAVDLEGNITSWNIGAQNILGYSSDEVLGKSTEILYLPQDYEARNNNIKTLLKDGVFRAKRTLIKKDKNLIDVELTGSLLKNIENIPIGMIGYFKDVTEQEIVKKKFEESNYNLQQYMDSIDKIGIGIFVVDDDFTVRYMNNTMIEWFGDQTNKTCYSAVAGINEPCSYCKIHDVIHNHQKVIYEPKTPDGQFFDIIATPLKNSDGTTSKMEIIRNITEKKQSELKLVEQKERLFYQAHHDALTGLANRILFNDRLEQGIKKAKRNHTILALLFIDLDYFKEINDSLGHDIGDKVLLEVTKKLQSITREKDTLARLGGDEFTIIIEDLSQEQDASTFAQHILKALSEPIEIEEHTLYISSSIGISLYPNDGLSAQDLLKFADSAMYKAKDEGRNNFQFYSAEMTELAFERIVMETSIRQAIEKKEFVVYYQPQINGDTDELVGMEALVRWKHPVMGIVSPDKFIPLAEKTGLVIEIDQFVMQEAMRQFKTWYKEGLNPGKLALNLTTLQLNSKDFITNLQYYIDQSGMEYTKIELELTEGQIMKNPQEAIKTLQEISDLGIRLAVDDFGTGYSSLSYLKKLPINKLKIDQSFVRELPDDEEDGAIVTAIIALAKSLNLDIITEGVETEAQRDFVVKKGCKNIQGYFYSKPIPAQEIEKKLVRF